MGKDQLSSSPRLTKSLHFNLSQILKHALYKVWNRSSYTCLAPYPQMCLIINSTKKASFLEWFLNSCYLNLHMKILNLGCNLVEALFHSTTQQCIDRLLCARQWDSEKKESKLAGPYQHWAHNPMGYADIIRMPYENDRIRVNIESCVRTSKAPILNWGVRVKRRRGRWKRKSQVKFVK